MVATKKALQPFPIFVDGNVFLTNQEKGFLGDYLDFEMARQAASRLTTLDRQTIVTIWEFQENESSHGWKSRGEWEKGYKVKREREKEINV